MEGKNKGEDDNRLVNQYMATFAVNVISVAQGTAIGWLSPFLPLLQSSDSPLLSGAVTDEQASWIASLLCVGAFVGVFFYGWAADKFGRKLSLCFTALPLSAFWCCVIFGQSVELLYVGRFLSGMSAAGVFALVPLYISEIADDKIRGQLGSTFILFINLGTLVAFISGTYLTYQMTAILMLLLPTAFLVFFIRCPETPQFLMTTGEKDRFEDAQMFFRGKATIEISNEKHAEKLMMSDFTSRSARKAIIIGIVLIWLNQFSGCFALINYTAQIFEESGSLMSPNLSAIIVGIIQIGGSYVSTFLVDKLGRKLVYAGSAIGSTLGLLSMGTHSYLKEIGVDVASFDWVPVASLSFVIFIASVGILPLAFVILSEILPLKIRSFVTSLCTGFLWIFGFVVIKYFPKMIASLGMYGSMWTFSACCFFGMIFNLIFVPETKGKSIEEIVSILEGEIPKNKCSKS